MKPAASRLLLLHGGAAYRRLGAIVAGVALGVGLLLILLGAFLHMPDRDARAAWTDPEGQWLEYDASDELVVPEPTSTTMLAASTQDYFEGTTATVLRMAAAVHTDLTLPHDMPVPGPGEYYASPAMIELIESVPADQLEDRYGQRVGELPREMLSGPSHLVVLAGAPWDSVAPLPGTRIIEGFPTDLRYSSSLTFQMVLALGAIAILVPIVLLISIVSQLGAAERRDRLATVRLIGAGKRAVAWLSAWEMALTALVGGALGLAVAAALRPAATQMLLNGTTSYAADLTPSWAWTAGVVLGIAALSAATAWWRAYSDDIGAPGATRERAEKPVTAWRTTTLAVGIALFSASTWIAAERRDLAEVGSYGFLLGFAMIAVGIVIAGPWVTRVASTAFRSMARSAAAVVAAGRLERHPRATFRTVAGLVVAVFLVSVFAGSVSSIQDILEPRDRAGLLVPEAVLASTMDDLDADAARAALASVEGVEAVVVGYRPVAEEVEGAIMSAEDARTLGAVGVPDSPGVAIDLFGMLADSGANETIAVDDPVAAPSATTDRVAYVVAVTDGETPSVERARTALSVQEGTVLSPITREDYGDAGMGQLLSELAVMAYLGMGIAVGISGLSLAVATIAAALDRRRTFGLLRLAGMPMRQLRATIAIEAVIPLAATLLASAGLGFAVAWALITGFGNGASVGWPDGRYWLAIAASLSIAAVAVTGSFGTVRRATQTEVTRFE
ncbi:FtsX-like permease family protein [Demequina sp. SO4-13]|uniref:FtsX-like permease family protein n=1 Tax=Demequina sp. SO4-13 TaxID=3401027 RepID=UPI003AF43759